MFGLYDDPVAHGRLYQPLGYWNALGIFAAMTVVLCLGAAMRGRTQWVRVAAAAALPPVVGDALLHVQPRLDDRRGDRGRRRAGTGSRQAALARHRARADAVGRARPRGRAPPRRPGPRWRGRACGVRTGPAAAGDHPRLCRGVCGDDGGGARGRAARRLQRDRPPPLPRRARRGGARRARGGDGDLRIAAPHGLAGPARSRVQAAGARLRSEPAPRDAVAQRPADAVALGPRRRR